MAGQVTPPATPGKRCLCGRLHLHVMSGEVICPYAPSPSNRCPHGRLHLHTECTEIISPSTYPVDRRQSTKRPKQSPDITFAKPTTISVDYLETVPARLASPALSLDHDTSDHHLSDSNDTDLIDNHQTSRFESLEDITARHRSNMQSATDSTWPQRHLESSPEASPEPERRCPRATSPSPEPASSTAADEILGDEGFGFYDRFVQNLNINVHVSDQLAVLQPHLQSQERKGTHIWRWLCALLVFVIVCYAFWCHINGPEFAWLKQQRVKASGMRFDEL